MYLVEFSNNLTRCELFSSRFLINIISSLSSSFRLSLSSSRIPQEQLWPQFESRGDGDQGAADYLDGIWDQVDESGVESSDSLDLVKQAFFLHLEVHSNFPSSQTVLLMLCQGGMALVLWSLGGL